VKFFTKKNVTDLTSSKKKKKKKKKRRIITIDSPRPPFRW